MSDLPVGIEAITSPAPGWRITTAAASALLLAQGAQLVSWRPGGQQDVLWLSKTSSYRPGSAVRGGIPLCFPYFANGPADDRRPSHGFARIVPWNLVEASVDDDGTARLTLGITGDQVQGTPGAENFPPDASATLRFAIGTPLVVELTVTSPTAPLEYEEALHTYFAVGHAAHAHIDGLDGAGFTDRKTGQQGKQSGPICFDGDMFDRLYDSDATATIGDTVLHRTITIAKQHSRSTVVWNPGAEESANMADVHDGGWKDFVCVETANARSHSVHLPAGGTHTMTAEISLAEDASLAG